MKSKVWSPACLVLLVAVSTWTASAAQVVRPPAGIDATTARWDWALKNAAPGEAFYVGYSISRMMARKATLGTHVGGTNVSLYQIVTGKKPAAVAETPHETAQKTLDNLDHPGKGQEKVEKEMAFLFWFDGKRAGQYRFSKLHINNIELPVRLRDDPIYWLGRSGQKESLQLLQKLFAKSRAGEPQRKVMMAIALHDGQPRVLPFLKGVATGGFDNKTREEATFWIGEQDDAGAVACLLDLARRDDCREVREKAVFGLYRIKSKAADRGLIELARGGAHKEVRQKAVFWLGQKAQARSAQVLGDVAEDDPDIEIRKQALFSLAQLKNGKGIPRLIKIAKTHPGLEIRKQAIFWLGQSGDPRALDCIIEILESK